MVLPLDPEGPLLWPPTPSTPCPQNCISFPKVFYLGEVKTKLIWKGHEALCPQKSTFEQSCLKIQQTGSGQILIKVTFLCTSHSVTNSPWATTVCFGASLLVLYPMVLFRPHKAMSLASFLMQLRPPLKSCFPSPFGGFTTIHIKDECACNLINNNNK